jgi:hypothetical protein
MQRIRKAASNEIRKLKAGNIDSKFMEQSNLKNWKTPKKFHIWTLQVFC